MSGRIMITPQELNEGATYLRARLAEMSQQVNDLNNRIMDISGRWEGLSQGAYMNRYQELLPILRDTMPEVIEGLAMKLDASADTMRETDEALASSL